MKILALFMIASGFWMVFEIWRAPLMEETADGKLRTKRPPKKVGDLFKSKSGRIADLEKERRGRSKY